MNFIDKQGAIEKMNKYGAQRQPFLFIISFDLAHNIVLRKNRIAQYGIQFSMNNTLVNYSYSRKIPKGYFQKYSSDYQEYAKAFSIVKQHLHLGNSYLVNLTFPTPIKTSFTLSDIYYRANSTYKLLIPNLITVFSPERFIKIRNGIISSNPMKGTIDASLPSALQLIKNDKKEIAEHITIVDLIRNDLSIVAKQVEVCRFRYIDEIISNDKKLLQVSSLINGRLPNCYHSNLGDIVFALLPAGSITGAPKEKTIEIIREAEKYDRGFYTGIFGYFDGINLDAAVMIRFIEKTPAGLIFKSGGGITVLSDLKKEYEEMNDKVYLPFYFTNNP